MGICRDCWGRLSYTLTYYPEKGSPRVFSVTKGENKMYRHEPYMLITPTLIGGNWLWDTPPKFDSFVKAVAFLKENKEYML